MENSANHWPNFLEFSKYELGSGGPDPHLKLAAAGMNMTEDPLEKIWRAGCYVGPYEINMGSVIWEEWPLSRVLDDELGFKNWISDTWPNWQIRRERRAARTVNKMFASMLSYAKWCSTAYELREEPYDVLWDSADASLIYFGRYALIKVLQALFQGRVIANGMPDIRPAGAWSPRMTLAFLYPEEPHIVKGNTTYHLQLVNDYIKRLQKKMTEYLGFEPSLFQIEVLLCNYRQVMDERNGRYAGWSLDMDLEHRRHIEEHWPDVSFPFYMLRENLFPVQHLGELQNWDAPRKHLCGYRGYFWSDLHYSYSHSISDLSNPVKWSDIPNESGATGSSQPAS